MQPFALADAPGPLPDLPAEHRLTRRVLAVLPADRLAWRPHPRSWTLLELATHLAHLPDWGTRTLAADHLDLAATPPLQDPPTDAPAVRAHFERHAAAFEAAVAEATPDALAAPWTLRHGEHVLFTAPRLAVLRSTVINHSIHHRGALTVYLRCCDVLLPPVYGPTADM